MTRVKVFVTGATGFIGTQVVRRLRERGDEVAALVRAPSKAGEVRGLGCAIVEGDLSDEEAIRGGLRGADAALHVAGMYKVGIPSSEHEAMYDANVRGSRAALDAAIEAGVRRIVYVSTTAVYGNTRGQAVDESYVRPQPPQFLSYYDQTKYEAHQLALDRIGKGAPIVIVQPGAAYGANDPSAVGLMVSQARAGQLKLRSFASTGFSFVHVEDVADGILLAHDKGRIGEAYNLGGENSTLGELVDKTALLSGRRPPRITMPVMLMKLAAPIGPLVGKAMGFPPNLGELISTSDGVTFWVTGEKARRELGFQARDLDAGLRQTLGT